MDNMDNWVLPPRDRTALDRLDLESLNGLTVPQARARVKEAGGVLRAIVEGEAITLDYRPERVTVVTDDDRARVVQVLPDLG